MWCCSKSAAVWGTPAVALTHPGRQPVTQRGHWLADSDRADYTSLSKASGTVRLCKLAAYSGIATEQET
jgi:hypothetical protein